MAASNILFDEGAQCSFVTEKLAKKLLITSTGKESLCISGFGDTERRVQQLDSATLYLQAEHENIPIKVLIVPEISKPIKTYRCQVGKLDYLTELNLAHPATAKEDFEIEILVGADHYWDVVQENVVRGKGPTAVQSKVGYLLSGPLSIDACTKEMETPLRKAAIHISTSRIKEDNDIDTNMKYEMVIKRSGSKSTVRKQLCSRWRNERFHKSYGKYGDSDFVSDEIHFQDDVLRRGRWCIGESRSKSLVEMGPSELRESNPDEVLQHGPYRCYIVRDFYQRWLHDHSSGIELYLDYDLYL